MIVKVQVLTRGGPGYRGRRGGGHKRHHLKNDKDLKKARQLELTKIQREKTKKHELKSSKSNVFPSMNSLFGHMRFHPDRGWKGTQPPSLSDKHSRNSSSLSESAAVLELEQEGDKRGRTLDPVEAVCDLDSVQAACNLIELSRDGSRLHKQKIDEVRQRKKLKINDESTTYKSLKPKNSGKPVDEFKLQIRMDDQKAVSFDSELGVSRWSNEDKGKRKRDSDEQEDESHSMITKKKKEEDDDDELDVQVK
ncbi:hypothetical protein OIU78_019209 [Salix suchowensis]|nr:hypothetical protein OIU78_019209 [Salix suchowensis]